MNEHMQRVVSDVERAIHSICRDSSEYATRDAIASFLLSDTLARAYLSEQAGRDRQPVEWVAGNTVDWFSAWMTRGMISTRDRYERTKIRRKWAYRPLNGGDVAGSPEDSVKEFLRQLGVEIDPVMAPDTETKAVDEPVPPAVTAQGWMENPAARRVVEQRAMAEATDYYAASGWDVIDVSAAHPFDLLCRRNGRELHVEVKGTTTEGREVVLTPNEVAHARAQHPNVALVVVSRIRVSLGSDGMPLAHGGNMVVYEPWTIDSGCLTPLSFTWTAP